MSENSERTRITTTKMVRARRSPLLVLGVACVLGYLLLAIVSGGQFVAANSVRGFLSFIAVPILIGLAQMACLAVGQMNLAVGALGGCSAALMAVLMQDHGFPPILAVLTGVLTATSAGAVNGIIVVATRINGFIVTLATMSILLGLQYKLVSTFTVDGYSPGLRALGASSILVVPTIFLVALAVAAALAFFYRRTVAGRHLLAYGGNPLASRLSGVSEPRSLILAHTLSGLLIGIAAVVSVASLPGINRSVGGDWLLSSFAAPIIGGVALTGGNVAVLGTVLAAVLVRLIDSARTEFALDPSWVSFTVGAVVLGTVVASTLRSRRPTDTAPPTSDGLVLDKAETPS